MTPIKAINNHNGHPDIYVTVTGMRNEAFKSEGNSAFKEGPVQFHEFVIKFQTMAADNSNGLLQITAILWKWHLMSEFKDGFLTGRQSQY